MKHILLSVLLASACVSDPRPEPDPATFPTYRDAAGVAGVYSCARMLECYPDTYAYLYASDAGACIEDAIEVACTEHDCAAPYTGLDALVDCWEAFRREVCVTVSVPRGCPLL